MSDSCTLVKGSVYCTSARWRICVVIGKVGELQLKLEKSGFDRLIDIINDNVPTNRNK